MISLTYVFLRQCRHQQLLVELIVFPRNAKWFSLERVSPEAF